MYANVSSEIGWGGPVQDVRHLCMKKTYSIMICMTNEGVNNTKDVTVFFGGGVAYVHSECIRRLHCMVEGPIMQRARFKGSFY